MEQGNIRACKLWWSEKSPLFRLLATAGAALTIASTVFLGVYVANFWHLPLSDQPQDWGVFGDYVGGTVGTVFAFGAFVGVLVTLYSQWIQTTLQKTQHKLDELRGFLAKTTGALDAILYKKVLKPGGGVVAYDTVYAQLIETVLHKMKVIDTPMGREYSVQTFDTLGRERLNHFRVEIDRIQREFSFVILCLREYKEKEGNQLVVAYYCNRLFEVACFLQQIRIAGYSVIIDEQLVADFFSLANVLGQYPAGANITISAEH